jgi:hypothetical protein
MAERPTPEEQVKALYEEAESRTAKAMEQLVARPAFAELLAWSTENVLAIGKIVADTGDLVMRNLRIAGRADINRLARQLNRTEDKLELLLQEVEALQEQLRAQASAPTNGAPAKRPAKAAARRAS